jgi:Cu+-exporting ATPase
MVMEALAGGQQPLRKPPGSPPAAPKPESLVKDPVCGTFVASSSKWVTHRGGETYHFCSADCRDKFAA